MRLSRSKVDLFIQCPLCFWLDQKSKVKRPSGPPFSLNIAVDHLLKNEFDACRGKDVPERLARENLSFVPTNHPLLSRWRENFKGVTRQYRGIEFFGAIDDLWHDMFGVHYVVDYKATSKADEVSLDADWQIAYKRQVEFYQWLLRGNDLEVSNQAWFVYANGIKGDGSFDDQLAFKTKLISYDGSDAWIEPTLDSLIECLASESPPPHTTDCPYCQYVAKRRISDTQNVPDYQPIAVNVRIPTKSIRTANKDAERDFALEILEAYPDHRCQVDDLVARVIKKNSGRITMPNKKRVLEVIYALQEAGKIRLQNGMAILVRTS
jgi:hypothetical protein